MQKGPKVSVVMSVYNGERYLIEAVQSILCQTFPDFEFIIINDGSTDRTPQILSEFDDPRVKVVSQLNRGLTVSLNNGIRLARGEYIARMDADDVSEPQRLEQEVKLLDRHPDVALVACWYKVIDEYGEVLASRKLPVDSKQLAMLLKDENPICHGSVLIRKKVLEDVGLYNESLRYAQDYELWLRMLHKSYKFGAVPEFLYRYRLSPDSLAKFYAQRKFAALVKRGRGVRLMNFSSLRADEVGRMSERRKRALYHYAIGTLKLEDECTRDARQWLLKSIRTDPTILRSWCRLVLSFLPRPVRSFFSKSIRRGRDLLLWLRLR